MAWKDWIIDFTNYLKLERSLSANTVMAYGRDLRKLQKWAEDRELAVHTIGKEELSEFIQDAAQAISARSQARLISSIRSFFLFLFEENYRKDQPSELLSTPKIGRYLPDTLSLEEIDALIAAIDRSTAEGQRNVAILETLYGSGLRVSELTELCLSDLYFEEDFIRVRGKGKKERLVPVSKRSQKLINIYCKSIRNHLVIQKGADDILFLNRRGGKLSRVMIFLIIKHLATLAGIQKKISPHTFRHSFATHLVQGGADLRVVQELLGHESILTTEIYTHIDQQYLRETVLQFHPRGK